MVYEWCRRSKVAQQDAANGGLPKRLRLVVAVESLASVLGLADVDGSASHHPRPRRTENRCLAGRVPCVACLGANRSE